jgi:acyl-coenzyme A synthetase/AMP-(fatty) acid ligase
MKTLELSSFENWFTAETVPHVPYEKTFEQAEWEPFCVLHTSGSTGLPKPVVVRNVRLPSPLFSKQLLTIKRKGMLAISDAYHTIPDWKTYTHWIPAWTQIAKRHFVPVNFLPIQSHNQSLTI